MTHATSPQEQQAGQVMPMVGMTLYGLVARVRMELSWQSTTLPCFRVFTTREQAEAEKENFERRCREPTDSDLDCAGEIHFIDVCEFVLAG